MIVAGTEATNLSQVRILGVSQASGDVNINAVFSSESFQRSFSVDGSVSPGGGLFNFSGRLVGMGSAEGDIIPAEVIKSALDSYFWSKEIVRANFGVRYSPFGPAGSKIFGLTAEDGVLLRSSPRGAAVVQGSPAARAGFQENDVIIRVNGEAITSRQPLDFFLNKSKPGDLLKLTVIRNAIEREIEITLSRL